MRSTSSWLPTPRTSGCAHCWRRPAASLKSWDSRSACIGLHTSPLCISTDRFLARVSCHCCCLLLANAAVSLLRGDWQALSIMRHHSASVCLKRNICKLLKQCCHDNPMQMFKGHTCCMLAAHINRHPYVRHTYRSFVLMCGCTTGYLTIQH